MQIPAILSKLPMAFKRSFLYSAQLILCFCVSLAVYKPWIEAYRCMPCASSPVNMSKARFCTPIEAEGHTVLLRPTLMACYLGNSSDATSSIPCTNGARGNRVEWGEGGWEPTFGSVCPDVFTVGGALFPHFPTLAGGGGAVVSPVPLAVELPSSPMFFSGPWTGVSASGVSKFPSESELWENHRRGEIIRPSPSRSAKIPWQGTHRPCTERLTTGSEGTRDEKYVMVIKGPELNNADVYVLFSFKSRRNNCLREM